MENRKKHALTLLIAALFLLFCFFGAESFAEPSVPVKVILDCDMGYRNDDALSLSMLLKAEERGLVEILGITLEGGNCFIDAPYENNGEIQYGGSSYTDELLASLHRADIPYFRGTDFPSDMGRDCIQALDAFFKGLNYGKFNDSYGAIHFFAAVDPVLLCDSKDAADFLIRSVQENPDEIVLFAVGPTMNVANAVKRDPDFASHVKAIYYMGGALGGPCLMENNRSEPVMGVGGANVTPYAEYNVIYDPASFLTCITAPFPSQTILPGSCNVDIDPSIAEKLTAQSDGTGVSGLWAAHFKENLQDYPFWDPLTVFAFLCPDAVADASVEYVTVNTDRLSEAFGRTDSYSAEEYNSLSTEQRSLCGQAEIVYKLDGFWDYTIDLLCN